MPTGKFAEILKAKTDVEAYTRRSASGKLVRVKSYKHARVALSGRVAREKERRLARKKENGPIEKSVIAVLKVRGVIPNKPGVKNWVEVAGGLPAYIDDVAGALYTKRGFTVSHAIASAVNKMKKWARGGGDVSAATQAKAQRALAQWEKMKASTKVKKDAAPQDEVEAVLALGVTRRMEILRDC